MGSTGQHPGSGVRQAAQILQAQPDIWITAKPISQWLDEAQLLEISTHELLLFRRSKLPQTDQALQALGKLNINPLAAE